MGKPLFVFHVDHPRPGRLAAWAQEHFGGFDTCHAHRDALPDPTTLSGPVIVLGGPMGVRDLCRMDWLAKEAQWISSLLARNHPLLGICLGAQLMGHALGHEVISCPKGEIECGYHPIVSPFGLPQQVYHWHRDGIILNPERPGISLAHSAWLEGRATQAFCTGRALGVQFHPEVDTSAIEAWVTRDFTDTLLPGARAADTHLPDHALHGTAVAQWLDAYLAQLWSLIPEVGLRSAA